MWRKTMDVVGSMLCVAAILVAVLAVDARLRDRMLRVADDVYSGDLSFWATTATVLGGAAMQSLRELSMGHEPLLLFASVSIGLVLLMLRV